VSSSILVGDVVSYLRGITFKPDDKVEFGTPNSVVCMRTKNVQNHLDESDLISVPESFVRRKELYLKKGDILISSANSWDLVGKCCLVPDLKYNATLGGFISAVRVDSNKVDSNYFYRWLSSPNVQHTVRHLGRQTTNISNLPVDQFLGLKIPLPSLPEQKRIAAILDKADAIRRKRQQAIQLADQFLRAVFLDMFGNPVTNLKGWDIGTIRDLVTEAKYGTSLKAHATEGAFPVLRMGNITYDGGWDFTELKYVDLTEKDKPKYLIKKRDLIFNRTNSKELVGKTAVYESDDEMAIAGYLIRVRTNEKGNPFYISGYLNSNHGKSSLQGMCKSIVGMANINAQELQDIQILLPPKDLQDEFEKIVIAVRSRTKKMGELSSNSSALFQSLSQKAFAGDL